MDAVFKALADPSRRLLLDNLDDRDGQTLGELCTGLSMARQSVSKHLAILEAARLVTTTRRGREKLHHLNAEPINAVADRWIDRYRRQRPQADHRSDGASAAAAFVYTAYIRTTPERLWHAITNPALAACYLGHAIESDWLRGSTYVWVEDGVRTAGPELVVLESDPYQRLAFTFPAVAADPVRGLAAERPSRVAFDIEMFDDQVRLTVTHDGLQPDGIVHQSISRSWPLKLSSLKSELERAALPSDTQS